MLEHTSTSVPFLATALDARAGMEQMEEESPGARLVAPKIVMKQVKVSPSHHKGGRHRWIVKSFKMKTDFESKMSVRSL